MINLKVICKCKDVDIILEAKKCKECGGFGGGHADYLNSDHNWERGTGDFVKCENCNGSGEELDQEIVRERIFESLSDEHEKKLEELCFKENPTVLDDDMPDFFENWMGEVSLEVLINSLK